MTMTLNEYANTRNNVILFYASAGTPLGNYTVLGYPDLDFVDRLELLNLNGTVDEEGIWEWDGKNKPVDDQRNSFIKLQAYQDAKRYETIINEYLSSY